MYNVLIIGAGSIGALKDEKFDSPQTDAILTHAHAVKVHPDYRLFAIVDKDRSKLIKASTKWGVEGYPDIKMVDEKNIDIVVIATPTETHLEVYEAIKHFNLKAIIIEKPCTGNMNDARRMMKDKRIVVNYTRRFIPEYKKLRDNLTNHNILSCVIHYVRGLRRDGCHAIDLCQFLFGGIWSAKRISIGPSDYSREDTTDCVWMRAERCPNIVMVPGDGRIADCFDFQIMLENQMLCLFDHGSSVFTRPVKKEKIYGDYYSLYGESEKCNPIDFKNRLLMNLYDEICEFITNGINPCSIIDAVNVHRAILKVKNDY